MMNKLIHKIHVGNGHAGAASVNHWLAGVINGSQLTLGTFHTFVVAAGGILNTRLLVPVPVDRRDSEGLTPLSFLYPGVIAVSSSEILPPLPRVQLSLSLP